MKERESVISRRNTAQYAPCFFFSSRRRHTRLQGDWSSDVCSSDLPRHRMIHHTHLPARSRSHLSKNNLLTNPNPLGLLTRHPHLRIFLNKPLQLRKHKIGRASCRERV